MRCCLIAALAVLIGADPALAQDHQHHDHAEPPVGTHESSEAGGLTNPVPADRLSLIEGRQLYGKHCVACHGESGTGDVHPAGDGRRTKPVDLTDRQWTHGSSDGDIFIVVRDGVRQSAMRGYGAKLNTRELWSIVNYLRSLGASPTQSP